MKNGGWIVTGIAALALGGLIGAGVALLLAPYSGRTTRALLRSQGVALRDKATEEALMARSNLRHEWNGLASSARLRANDLGNRLQHVVDHPQSTVKGAFGALPHAH